MSAQPQPEQVRLPTMAELMEQFQRGYEAFQQVDNVLHQTMQEFRNQIYSLRAALSPAVHKRFLEFEGELARGELEPEVDGTQLLESLRDKFGTGAPLRPE